MPASLLRKILRMARPWKPLAFPNQNFVRIPLGQKVEEETLPGYVASQYYPARIGEIIQDRYQVVGKLGFGVTSTVWLARDLKGRQHVALKMFINSASMGNQLDDEINIYRRIESGPKRHPGRSAVRSLMGTFDLEGPDGEHRCLVHPPLLESVLTLLYRNPIQRLPEPVLAFILQRLFLALDYLHNECNIIHTDIKAANIMFEVRDNTVLDDYEEEELDSPCPRKEVDGRIIYMSRELNRPREWGAPVLCDFGSAIFSSKSNTEKIQPDVYRAPKVILNIPWTHSVDMWNAGCMIWDILKEDIYLRGKTPSLSSTKAELTLLRWWHCLENRLPNYFPVGN